MAVESNGQQPNFGSDFSEKRQRGLATCTGGSAIYLGLSLRAETRVDEPAFFWCELAPQALEKMGGTRMYL